MPAHQCRRKLDASRSSLAFGEPHFTFSNRMNRRHFLSTTTAAASLALGAHAAPAASRVKIAVIGHTGRGNYGHGLDTMWLNLPETEIVGVADADAKGLEAELKKLKTAAKGFADYKQMLAEVKPDIASIGPRHIDQHRDMVLACVEAGVKGIYIEKPFVRSLAEADEVVAACRKGNVKLAIAHRNRYHPVMPLVAQLVKDGAIGRFLELRARGKEDPRGGALDMWVLGSHLFNLAHFFCGRPIACSGVVMQNGKPITKADVRDGDEGIGPLAGNEVHARFEMESGVPVFFDSVQNAGVKSTGFGIQLIGTEGVIDLRTDVEPAAQIFKGSPFRPTAEQLAWIPITTGGIGKPEPVATMKGDVAGHLIPGRDLIASIKEDRQPLCSAEDGRVIIEMISAVLESHRKQGQRVTLPLETRVNPLTRL
jgi:predicted dehydrogenase